MIATSCTTSLPLRLLLVEDQGMMRAFFERWLATLPRFQLAASVGSGEEAISIIEQARPDIALVDLQLPGMDGLEFILAARQVRPQLLALMVTSQTDALTLTRIRESGIEGYVEKESSPEVLTQALTDIANGQPYYSVKFRQTLAHESAKAQSVGKILSRREQQVLAQLLGHRANKDIAELMGLSIRTVEFHRANLMAKLEASNFNELLDAARLRGWTPSP
jgi:DNA-binding NarL/FixJ family response regulator